MVLGRVLSAAIGLTQMGLILAVCVKALYGLFQILNFGVKALYGLFQILIEIIN